MAQLNLNIKLSMDNTNYRKKDNSLDYKAISETLLHLSILVRNGTTWHIVRDSDGNIIGKFEINMESSDLHSNL